MFETFLCLKTKQNPGMSKEENLGSEFYYRPKEQETAERNASRRGRHFTVEGHHQRSNVCKRHHNV